MCARSGAARRSSFSTEDRTLSDGYRLIYYDQRGRGGSAARVKPEEVSLASEIADLDAVRQAFHLDRVVLLGHSWGAVLALEYAVRYPQRLSRMILMNPAPTSTAQYRQARKARLEKLGSDLNSDEGHRGHRSCPAEVRQRIDDFLGGRAKAKPPAQ